MVARTSGNLTGQIKIVRRGRTVTDQPRGRNITGTVRRGTSQPDEISRALRQNERKISQTGAKRGLGNKGHRRKGGTPLEKISEPGQKW